MARGRPAGRQTTLARSRTRRRPASKPVPDSGGRPVAYADRSTRPLHVLAFVTPLVLAYQVALLTVLRDPASQSLLTVAAHQRLADLFGAAPSGLALLLPGALVLLVLAAWHMIKRDPWVLRPATLAGMAGESLLWVLPLLTMAVLFGRVALLQHDGQSGAAAPGLATLVALSVGAGVYEEFAFRMVVLGGAYWVLRDLLTLPQSWAVGVAVAVSAGLFAAYHTAAGETVRFDGLFFFRAASGVYFAGLYVWRGFGVVVGTHAAYDILVLTVLR